MHRLLPSIRRTLVRPRHGKRVFSSTPIGNNSSASSNGFSKPVYPPSTGTPLPRIVNNFGGTQPTASSPRPASTPEIDSSKLSFKSAALPPWSTSSFGPPDTLSPSSTSTSSDSEITPLETHLTRLIESHGPLPLPAFLTQLLTNPQHGYYPTRGSATSTTALGAQGDFITSPEISQVFGELVGIWGVGEIMGQGLMQKGVRVVEYGAGTGRLMSDFLRILERFTPGVVREVAFVESSPVMRDAQRKEVLGDGEVSGTDGIWSGKRGETTVTWYADVSLLPLRHIRPSIFLLHEFLDALPSHVFQSRKGKWHELLVAAASTTSQRTAYGHTYHPSLAKSSEKDPFTLTLSPTPTPASMLLPSLNSARYNPLLRTDGATIEISEPSLSLSSSLAAEISHHAAGAALLVDYGPADTIPTGSLKGIRKHRRVSPFSRPIGGVDISFDVDFKGIVDAVLRENKGVEVWGPVEQGRFLEALGVRERGRQLEAKAKEGDRDTVAKGWRRIVEGEMGKVYKCMAIVPEGRAGGGGVLGFGGDLRG